MYYKSYVNRTCMNVHQISRAIANRHAVKIAENIVEVHAYKVMY